MYTFNSGTKIRVRSSCPCLENGFKWSDIMDIEITVSSKIVKTISNISPLKTEMHIDANALTYILARRIGERHDSQGQTHQNAQITNRSAFAMFYWRYITFPMGPWYSDSSKTTSFLARLS